jgi:hypothetical protein
MDGTQVVLTTTRARVLLAALWHMFRTASHHVIPEDSHLVSPLGESVLDPANTFLYSRGTSSQIHRPPDQIKQKSSRRFPITKYDYDCKQPRPSSTPTVLFLWSPRDETDRVQISVYGLSYWFGVQWLAPYWASTALRGSNEQVVTWSER